MDQFEREVAEMLHDRAAGMSDGPDATPELFARARRRRARKLTALLTAVVVVGGGTTAAVAAVVDRRGPQRLVTGPETSTSSSSPASTAPSSPTSTSTSSPTSTTGEASTVPTVACPVTYALTPDAPLAAPSITPRQPAAGNPAQFGDLTSFAATTDPRYVVLGPTGWKCRTTVSVDGQNGVVVSAQTTPGFDQAPISIINDWLWHGGVGSPVACSVFDDPAVVQYVTQNYPQFLPCPGAGRTVTRVDANVSTFVDSDGTRGAGRLVLPTASGADGLISVLTCRPTAGLTAADCDTVIADWIARNNSPG